MLDIEHNKAQLAQRCGGFHCATGVRSVATHSTCSARGGEGCVCAHGRRPASEPARHGLGYLKALVATRRASFDTSHKREGRRQRHTTGKALWRQALCGWPARRTFLEPTACPPSLKPTQGRGNHSNNSILPLSCLRLSSQAAQVATTTPLTPHTQHVSPGTRDSPSPSLGQQADLTHSLAPPLLNPCTSLAAQVQPASSPACDSHQAHRAPRPGRECYRKLEPAPRSAG